MEHVDLDDRSLLDAGTGTGILSIIAALAGAGPIVAFDNNEWAVANTIENLELNGVAEKVEVFQGEMEDVAPDSFDLIVANIQAFVIIPLLPTFAERLNGAKGRLITSGILIDDQNDLYNAARSAGLIPVDEDRENEWLGTTFALDGTT